MSPSSSAPIITVCPECHYGFRDKGGPGHEFVCTRKECGHRWEALGQTIRSVQGTQRRRAVYELAVVAGGTPLRATLATGASVIGRDEACQVVLDNLTASRRHARVTVDSDGATIEDLNSSLGTAVNGEMISETTRLWPGDQIIVGGTTLRYDVRYEALVSAPKPIADQARLIEKGSREQILYQGMAAETIPLSSLPLTFGRGADRDVVMSGPLICSRHAVLEQTSDGHYLSDAQTSSGTYVNGKPVIRSKLMSGDRIQIGSFLLRYEGDRLVRTERQTAIAVETRELTKQVGGTTLLDQLTFSLKPGEFVGLIGPSGAGKTTLLDALNGMRPATSGDVYLNDDSLYEEYARLRHHIGYVPQDDIIHRELTVAQALTYAAQLRLPADMRAEELARVVDETLEMLDLSHRRDVLISHLSGGQRKRVSVGVELLSRPGVLFLDEPTSGLDPGTEAKLMKLFRRLADQGRTVVCTTHVMENIDLFHKIVVLAPGGKLAYFGPPGRAKQFFEIEKFCDLYDRMEDETPTQWQERYRKSSQYRELIVPVMKQRVAARKNSTQRLISSQGVSWIKQWKTLTSRFVRLQWADRTNLAVMLAQPLLITALICVVCRDLAVINFLLVISSLWFGCSGAAQQIVKERAIYRRERMVNLRLDTYIFSKFIPLIVFTAFQAALMLGVTCILEDVEGSKLWLYVSFLLASWNGVGIGLLISASASNGDKAMSVVPLTLIPQIILAGVLVPLPDMNQPTQVASMLTAASWANQACEATMFDGRSIGPELFKEESIRPLWNLYPDDKLNTGECQAKFLSTHAGESVDRQNLIGKAFAVLSAFLVFMGGVTCWLLKRNDSL